RTATFFLFTPALLGACLLAIPARLESQPWMFRSATYLGSLTYSLYMVHFPIQLALVTLTDFFHVSRNVYLEPGTFLVFMGASWLAGHCSFRWLEMPAQAALRRLLVRNPG